MRRVKKAYCNGKPVSAAQLRMGLRVEREHRRHANPRKVACDHLLEFPGKPYYTELAKLEKKLKRRR